MWNLIVGKHTSVQDGDGQVGGIDNMGLMDRKWIFML